jgi:hypothetical protein
MFGLNNNNNQKKAERKKISTQPHDRDKIEKMLAESKRRNERELNNPLLNEDGELVLTKDKFTADIEGNLSIDFSHLLGNKDPNTKILVKVDAEALAYLENFLKNKELFKVVQKKYDDMLEKRMNDDGIQEKIDQLANERLETYKADFRAKIEKDEENPLNIE